MASCATKPAPEETPASPAEAAPETAAPAIDPVLLHELLDQAEAAIAVDHLTYPREGSAYTLYQRILDIEPGQEDAQRGMEHIVEQYIALAMRALERGQFASARSMLARARIINPDHPSIEPTNAQIRLLSQAQRKKLTLNQDQLRNEDPHTQRELKNMAQIPPNSSCRFTISARSDAQGRWIYQRLSEGAPQDRIRAQIQVRLPAAVERLCFPE